MTRFFFLVCAAPALLLIGLADTAAATEARCVRGDDAVRRVAIEVQDPSQGAPCEVVYWKDSEEPGVRNVLWRAQTDAAYCAAKAEELVGTLKSGGWSCTSTDEQPRSARRGGAAAGCAAHGDRRAKLPARSRPSRAHPRSRPSRVRRLRCPAGGRGGPSLRHLRRRHLAAGRRAAETSPPLRAALAPEQARPRQPAARQATTRPAPPLSMRSSQQNLIAPERWRRRQVRSRGRRVWRPRWRRARGRSGVLHLRVAAPRKGPLRRRLSVRRRQLRAGRHEAAGGQRGQRALRRHRIDREWRDLPAAHHPRAGRRELLPLGAAAPEP